MKKTLNSPLLIILLALSLSLVYCNTGEDSKKIKNVIIMIPDGTSSALLTLARWYNDNNPLAVDPYICGMIKTHNANGTFPDSAPAATAYATGVKSNPPYIGLNSDAEPQVSVLELARRKGLATGVVATSQFAHATPAAFVCHLNAREDRGVGAFKNLAKQFIYNSPNLVFAGGEQHLHDNGYAHLLQPNKIRLITDKKAFDDTKILTDSLLWALFPDCQDSTNFMSYECDRNTTNAPSLSEMTAKAIDLLNQNKKGFFLMVEGSQIDWAAHGNDLYAAVTEFVEFDKAVAKAIEFAKKNKNTVVIIAPDHGTGGITIGNHLTSKTYSRTPIRSIIDSLKKAPWSAKRLARMQADSARKSLQTCIGWTTGGHTAEDVFLAIYAPKNARKITGVIDNSEIGQYIAKILNLGDLSKATQELFSKHTAFFSSDEIAIQNADSLVVRKNGRKFTFFSNTNKLKINGEQEVRLPSIAVHINGIYYLPRSPHYTPGR